MLALLHREGLIVSNDTFTTPAVDAYDSNGLVVAMERMVTAATQTFDVTNRLLAKLDGIVAWTDPATTGNGADATAQVEGQQAQKKRGRPSAKDKEAAQQPAAETTMFDEPASGAKAGDDIFGETETATKPVSEAELKALLKEYMNKHGGEGVNKLTALLTTFGVKRFADLPADKYGECAAKARAEMSA